MCRGGPQVRSKAKRGRLLVRMLIKSCCMYIYIAKQPRFNSSHHQQTPYAVFPPMAQSAPLPTAGGEPIVAAKVQMVNNLPDM